MSNRIRKMRRPAGGFRRLTEDEERELLAEIAWLVIDQMLGQAGQGAGTQGHDDDKEPAA